MAQKPQKSSLANALDAFALTLIEEAGGSKVAPAEGVATEGEVDGSKTEGVEFRDRVGLFTALTRWVQVKHRIDPEDEKDQWSREFDRFHGRASGGKGRPRKNGDAAEAGDDTAGSPIPLSAFRPQR